MSCCQRPPNKSPSVVNTITQNWHQFQQKRRITTCTSQSWNKHHHIKVLHSCHNTTSFKTHTITISIKLFRNTMSTQIVWIPRQTTSKKQKHAVEAVYKNHKLLQQLTCKKTIPPNLWYLQGQLPTSSSLRLEGNPILPVFSGWFGLNLWKNTCKDIYF